MEDQIDDELNGLGASRRTFVKRIVAGTAFAAPFVASYDMQSLTQSIAGAQSQLNSTS